LSGDEPGPTQENRREQGHTSSATRWTGHTPIFGPPVLDL
jgi:hypothetical protein